MVARLHVGNLPYSFTSADLADLFRTYGNVRSAEVVADRATGESRGFGTVEMDSPEASHEAIQALNYSTFQGRGLTVRRTKERMWRVSRTALLIAGLLWLMLILGFFALLPFLS